MDVFMQEDNICLNNNFNNFDMEMLANNLNNTDLLIRTMKEQTDEIATLKAKLKSLNESAVQIQNVYSAEKDKNCKIDRENCEMKDQLSNLRQAITSLQNEMLNDKIIHRQSVADLEHRLSDQSEYTALCKQFLVQGNILYENNLSNSAHTRQFKLCKDHLQRKGENVNDFRRIHNNKVATKKLPSKLCSTIGTMTDYADVVPSPAAQPPPKKIYCDKSTMHSQTTATRGTSTSTFIKSVSIGTNFPEPISTEEIFRQTIVEVPELISMIDEFKWPVAETCTQTPIKTTESKGTMTRLKNIRQKINYDRMIKSHMLRNPSNGLYLIKKEEDQQPSPMGSMANLLQATTTTNLPINPQLNSLWQLLGQTIFSIVGSGQIFDQTAINENLNQIRSVIENHSIDNNLNIDNTMIQTMLPPSQKSASAYVGPPEVTIYENVVASAPPLGDLMDTDPPQHLIQCQSEGASGSSNFTEQDMMLPMEEEQEDEVDGLPPPSSGSNQFVEEELAQPPPTAYRNEGLFISDKVYSPESPELDSSLNHIFKIPTETARRGKFLRETYSCARIRYLKMSRKWYRPAFEFCCSANDGASNEDYVEGDGGSSLGYEILGDVQDHRQNRKRRKYSLDLFDQYRQLMESNGIITSSRSEERSSRRHRRKMAAEPLDTFPLISPIKELEEPHHQGQAVKESVESHKTFMESFQLLSPIKDAQVAVAAVPNSSKHISFKPKDDRCCDTEQFNLEEMRNFFKMPELIEPILDLVAEITTPLLPNIEDEPIESELVCQEESNFDSSPASPPPASPDEIVKEPMLIPHFQKEARQKDCIVKNIVRKYSFKKRNAIISHYQTWSATERCVLAKLKRQIDRYLAADWNSIILRICLKKLLKLTRKLSLLSESVLNAIESSEDYCLNMEFTPPAPALPRTHQQLIVLVKRIDEFIPTFSNYTKFHLERKLFTLGTATRPLPSIMNLTRFYIALVDSAADDNDDCSSIRFFIYKCFYYFNQKSIPMIYAILMAYPSVLPKFPEYAVGDDIAKTILSNSNSLILTLQCILINLQLIEPEKVLTGKQNDFQDYEKYNLSFLLKYFYRYAGKGPRIEHLIGELVERLRNNQLENLSYCLILVAKRKGCEWSNKNIIKLHLMPLLNDWLSQCRDSQPDAANRLATLIYIISSIVKTFQPNTEDIDKYYKTFANILDTTAHIPAVQEAAVVALLQTSRFGIQNVYAIISTWKPAFAISRKLQCMFNTFIHRKNKGYWQ